MAEVVSLPLDSWEVLQTSASVIDQVDIWICRNPPEVSLATEEAGTYFTAERIRLVEAQDTAALN